MDTISVRKKEKGFKLQINSTLVDITPQLIKERDNLKFYNYFCEVTGATIQPLAGLLKDFGILAIPNSDIKILMARDLDRYRFALFIDLPNLISKIFPCDSYSNYREIMETFGFNTVFNNCGCGLIALKTYQLNDDSTHVIFKCNCKGEELVDFTVNPNFAKDVTKHLDKQFKLDNIMQSYYNKISLLATVLSIEFWTKAFASTVFIISYKELTPELIRLVESLDKMQSDIRVSICPINKDEYFECKYDSLWGIVVSYV